MRVPPIEPLIQLARSARAATRRARWQGGLACSSLVAVVALLVARDGTTRARVGAALAIVAVLVLSVGVELVQRARMRDPERLLRGAVRRVDPTSADRALRALSLLGPAVGARPDGTSAELASMHVARTLAQIPSDQVLERASRFATRLAATAAIVGVCAVAVGLANAWSLLEGANVLLARRGVAPFFMQWLEGVDINGRPPDYLHQSEVHQALQSSLLPYGTVLTMRGVPTHPGRRLLLTDGVSEVPFVDDGAGGVVARWLLTADQTLRVAARFGEVVIPAPDPVEIHVLLDEAPTVSLEGAPREIHLVEATEDVSVRYDVADDHGLREVHLVLRSGAREERRVLARLDGETKTFRGGSVLKLRDAFLAKSHAPVSVTVEAKDGDPLSGPKWGSSEAITIIPPAVGEPEALRLDALRSLRSALVESLAWRLENDRSVDAERRKAEAAEDASLAAEDDKKIDHVLEATYGGLHVASRIRSLVAAQQQSMHKALRAEYRAPSDASHAGVVRATERFVLVADAIVRGLSVRDARTTAKPLADVAEDLALGESQAQSDALDIRSRGTARADAASEVLASGGSMLLRLGQLGRDLGEIVQADLGRVARARTGADLPHAELAARDLAARLRQPDPSFASRGRAQSALMAGGSGGPGGDEQPASDDVEQAFNEAAQDLERLAQDHAGAVAKTEQALAGATSDAELKQLRDEAKRHARTIREAARLLPAVGQGSDSWTSKGSAARELAEQMAQSLEDGRPDDAVQSGRSAGGSLDEAKKILQRGRFTDDLRGEDQKRVDQVRVVLEAELRWAEDQLRDLRRRAADRAREQLQQGGADEERLADRARELAQRGGGNASFPQQAITAIEDAERAARQAAEALKQGEADRGLDRQREVQRELEAARQQLRGDDEDESARSGDEGDGRAAAADPVLIPGARDHKGPEEFRRRVLRGLGQRSNGALRDAVKRYAEGLLR